MRLGRVDHTDGKAGRMQRHGQGHPIAAGGFEHDQGFGWRDTSGLEVLLELGDAGRGLSERHGWGVLHTVCGPGGGKGVGGYINPRKQPILRRNAACHRDTSCCSDTTVVPKWSASSLVIRGQATRDGSDSDQPGGVGTTLFSAVSAASSDTVSPPRRNRCHYYTSSACRRCACHPVTNWVESGYRTFRHRPR